MALIFWLIATVVLISESKASSTERCDTCDRVYRKSNDNCSGKQVDCGECIQGFEEHVDKFCHYVWNASHDSNATIVHGNSVILTCHFEEPVDCSWFRETPVEIKGSIRYVQGSGDNTKDCSLQIRNFKTADAGVWTCLSMGTSSALGILKSTFFLDISNMINDSESLVPIIEATQQSEYDGFLKSKRSTDDQSSTNLWFECRVKTNLPAILYWTLNGFNKTATASTASKRETISFLKMSIPTEHEKEMNSSILKCWAEYPNINQRFSSEIKITPVSYGQKSTIYITVIIGLLCSLLLGTACVLAYVLYNLSRKKNAEKYEVNTPKEGEIDNMIQNGNSV